MVRNAYVTKTESNIKDAMVRLLRSKSLADITISELAREARISRSTFYEHFGNTGDVYDALVGDVSAEMSPLMSQVMCADGFKPSGKPFCMLVREAGEHASVVGEARFAETLLSLGKIQEGHDLHALLVDAGYTQAEAQAVCSFQMSGCFSAARTADTREEDWAGIRTVIDRFILGGIAACLAAKRS